MKYKKKINVKKRQYSARKKVASIFIFCQLCARPGATMNVRFTELGFDLLIKFYQNF